MLHFDVFGRRIGVTRALGEWSAVYLGTEGKGREARDVAIPPWIEKDDIGRFLADLFHESASPEHPDVIALTPMEEQAAASIHLREERAADFGPYSEVSIAFVVDRVLRPAPDLGPLRFREQPRVSSFTKDYDAEPGHHPTDWPTRFDTSTWVVLSAWRASTRVAGAVLVHGSDDIDMLEGRDDLALIWDLRVDPEERGRGIGALLIQAAGEWAVSRGCVQLKVETQNINRSACALYAKCGFVLGSVDPQAYPELPDEIQMLWYKDL